MLLTDFQDTTFFVISSNLTFGKSEINYVSFSNERPKNWYVTFKSARLAFDTAPYKGKGKSHCIPDPQKNPLKWIAGWDPVWHQSWH